MDVGAYPMRALFILLFVPLLMAANLKLYLKDGTWHVVSEYKVEEDRVRFYSLERSDWEEIPLELVDLKRTEKDIADRNERQKEEAKLIDEEDKAEKEAVREVAKVPQETGVYYVDGKDLKPLKLA